MKHSVTQFPTLIALFDHEREFDRYTPIYFVGDPATQVFVVKEGKVKLSRISSTGREKVLDIFEVGEIFGELSLYADEVRSDQAIAMGRVKVGWIERNELRRHVASDSAVAGDLLKLMSYRLAEAQGQIETLSFDKTSERLAKTLLRMGENIGRRDHEGKLKIRHSYTHEELAQIIGTSREIISSALASFQKEGYIRYKRKNIEIIPEKIIHYLNSA